MWRSLESSVASNLPTVLRLSVGIPCLVLVAVVMMRQAVGVVVVVIVVINLVMLFCDPQGTVPIYIPDEGM